ISEVESSKGGATKVKRQREDASARNKRGSPGAPGFGSNAHPADDPTPAGAWGLRVSNACAAEYTERPDVQRLSDHPTRRADAGEAFRRASVRRSLSIRAEVGRFSCDRLSRRLGGLRSKPGPPSARSVF